MANFELTVYEADFDAIGVRPLFDENLYGSLLDECAPQEANPSLLLRPHESWFAPLSQRVVRRLMFWGGHTTYGEYDRETAMIEVACVEDVHETNDTVLHETKHFIDDITGELEELEAAAEPHLAGIRIGMGVGAAATAAGIGLLTHVNPLVSTPLVLASFGALSLQAQHKYTRSYAPDEVSAIAFASDPEILEAYGHILTYEQA